MGERRGTRGLELWCKRMTEGYPGVKVENMTTSWRDGLAFCAIIHHFRPDLIDFSKLNKNDIYKNNDLAFRIAEDHLGIPALLEPEDMVEYAVPDRLSILTYLSQFYQVFAVNSNSASKVASKRPPTTDLQRHMTATGSAPPKKAAFGALGARRDPCAKCGLPVFIAERLNVGKTLYHRTCFRCAKCDTQLILDNYNIENDELSCKTCPDKPKSDSETSIMNRSLSDEEKSASLKDSSDPYSANFETALENSKDASLKRNFTLDRMLGSAFQKARSEFMTTQMETFDSDLEEKPPDLPAAPKPSLLQELGEHSENIDFFSINNSLPSLSDNSSVDSDQQASNQEQCEPEDPVTKDSITAVPIKPSIRSRMKIFEASIENSAKSDVNNESQKEKILSGVESCENTPDDEQSSVKNCVSENVEPDNQQVQSYVLSDSSRLAESNEIISISSDDLTAENIPTITISDSPEHVSKSITSLNRCSPNIAEENVSPNECNDRIDEENASSSNFHPNITERRKRNKSVPNVVEESEENTSSSKFDPNAIEETEENISRSIPNLVIEKEKNTPRSVNNAMVDEETEEPPAKMEYPDDLNPFGDDEELDDDYAESLNPFGDSDEEKEEPEVNSKSLNPFGDDEEEEVVVPVTPQPRVRKLLKAPRISTTPISTPPKSSCPFSDEDEEVVRPQPSTRKLLKAPKISLTPLWNDNDDTPVDEFKSPSTPLQSRSEKSSLHGSGRKKKPAPKPPIPQELNETPYSSLSSNQSHREGHLPKETPKSRKTRRAPLPPTSTPTGLSQSCGLSTVSPIGKNTDTSQVTMDMNMKAAKDEINRNKQHDSDISSATKRLTMKEIEHQLEVVEIQMRGLEKNGVILEKLIREKSEVPGANPDEPVSPEVEDMILELFELVNEKSEFFRKQTELNYLRRQYRLENEQAEIENQLRILMQQPDAHKTDSDKAKEEELLNRMLEIVERRNEIVDRLEYDRRREAEEDISIRNHMCLYSKKRENVQSSSKKTSKKDKQKHEKDKKNKKSKGEAVEDDESKHTTDKKKKKMLKLF